MTIVTLLIDVGGGRWGSVKTAGGPGNQGAEALAGDAEGRLNRVGTVSPGFVATRRMISISRGTESPERSSHKRMVSAEAC